MTEHPDVLRARAETLTDCAELALIWEDKKANAGIVRHHLERRAGEAWAAYHRRTAPLEEAAEDRSRRPPASPPSAASSSGTSQGLTASSAAPHGGGEQRVPLDSTAPGLRGGLSSGARAEGRNPGLAGGSSNVHELRFAREAGDTCHICGQVVSWVDHLPPVGVHMPVRCFAHPVPGRTRLGYSVKVPPA